MRVLQGAMTVLPSGRRAARGGLSHPLRMKIDTETNGHVATNMLRTGCLRLRRGRAGSNPHQRPRAESRQSRASG